MADRKKQFAISKEKEDKIVRSYAHQLVDMLNSG